MGHYDECRPGYCASCGAAPGNMVNGVCPFCRKPDAKKLPMNKQLLTYMVMARVEDEYQDSSLSDSQFAEKLTKRLGAIVTSARVRQARIVLGIKGNKPADKLTQAKQHIINLLENPTLDSVRDQAREFANGL